MWTYLIVVFIIFGSLLALMGILVLLGRFRGGRYLTPIIKTLSKIGFMRRFFERMSRMALEKQRPELVSAVDKLQRLAGKNPDPQKAQQALSQLSPAERRAYMEYVQEQGAMPEPANRQMRRLQQRQQQTGRPGGTGGAARRDGKRKR